MKQLLIFIILLPVFFYTYVATSWTGSYIMLEENWKKHIVFTPETATESQQIYEIDKFIYAFKYQPIISIVCILSFLILIGIIISWISRKFRHSPKNIVN
ncbi:MULTISPECIES: DUF4306 domain-containing protein [unclassified Bacillus (in: firmicutes)]|uniref:DUF4306 domain-containing protein n=1 Tax=Bacillus bruguierae TaxID=3127667 RepID=A0ABU8FP54_9BACI|nr:MULTISPECIES: DUF4306 domain-containing protein [unclassified Bacillus (in: firmicutes)]